MRHKSAKRRWHGSTLEPREDVVDGQPAHGVPRLDGGRAHVRRQHHVPQVGQRVARGQRLGGHHVEAGAGDLTALETGITFFNSTVLSQSNQSINQSINQKRQILIIFLTFWPDTFIIEIIKAAC